MNTSAQAFAWLRLPPDSRVLTLWQTLLRLLAAPLIGGTWGVLCWWGDRWDGPAAFAVNAIGPWLLLAFAIGAWVRALLPGMLAATAALTTAVLTYYTTYDVAYQLDPTQGTRYFTPGGQAWLALALAAGIVVGALGVCWRRGHHPALAAGLLGGALAGEGIYQLREMRHYASEAANTPTDVALVLLCIALGLALPLVLVRLRRPHQPVPGMLRAAAITVSLALISPPALTILERVLRERYNA